MNKHEFLDALRNALRGYDCDDALHYYDELISDKTESGMSEYEAVTALGSVYDVAACIKAELVETRLTENRAGNPFKTFAKLTALCTSPVLFALALAFSITYFVLFVSFFAVGISLIAGGAWTIVMTVISAIQAAGEIGIAGVLIAAGAGATTAAILGILGILFYKLSMLLVKMFLKSYAKIISKSKRRKVNENFN